MDLGIAGKWALVGGASRGLGWGCAKALAEEGVNVVMVSRREDVLRDAAETLAKQVKSQVLWVAADITTPAGQDAAFAQHGQFDIVVNNAGGPPPGDFRDWEREDWIKALDANMLAPIALIKRTVDGMAERGFGRIVNITSSSVKQPVEILGLSNGARSGLHGFVAGVARQPKLVSRGVTINNLLPGKFDTDRIKTTLGARAQKTGESLETLREEQAKLVPAKRFGTAEEFGAFCAFMCSQQASYLTGQNILLDGGAYPGTY
ncbi:3-oxoacyl-ACP reductase [Comamonas serinivorans]|uniref:3-oxoacyl-ACP reductase n=1 Tax=Comamonas serinivorans TaxID=1082851 RepID=A0A1Y0EM91_9BURK|nr:SDR family oxidoreductase [Comamonas serinivorans]ARU04422.1 3-oxoacyl-ACP reductase [Comamonas serinivorans]